MRFSRSTHLLICLSLETLTSIIRTGSPFMVELIDLVNSAIIFLSQTTLLRCLTFPLGSQTVIITVPLFWIYLFLLDLISSLDLFIHLFYKGFPSTGEFWSCCCLSFHWLSIIFTTGCPVSSHCLLLFSCWLGPSSWSFETCSMGGYLKTHYFCCCSWVLWVGSGWNWFIYPSS